MIQLKETAGDTLVGAIDGVNQAYQVSFDFSDRVNVYVNGRLKIREWDDGFVLHPPRTVLMKEPPLPGDSLEIEYHSTTKTGGGALGGVPTAPLKTTLIPAMQADQDTPGAVAEVLEPGVQPSESVPYLLPGSLVPAILHFLEK